MLQKLTVNPLEKANKNCKNNQVRFDLVIISLISINRPKSNLCLCIINKGLKLMEVLLWYY